MIRRAVASDLDAVAALYDEVHEAEERHVLSTGWKRGVYPVRTTAEAALRRDDLFVLERNGAILGTAVINQLQVYVYTGAPWVHAVPDGQVCVLHTLVISPRHGGQGLGKLFVRFYEDFAKAHQCPELRIDTNERNMAARAMYRKLGYREIAVVPTVFNGISGVQLVLLEKWLDLSRD